jgi:CheY-like chemotaxis protein
MEKQPIRILVVDDEPNVRRGLKMRLSLEDDLEVVGEAEHGAAAIEQVCVLRPDVVLMDLQMPEMDGFQATAELRGNARFASLPIIAMTAHATIEERQRCLAAGMNAHVAKPIDPALLFETLARFYQPMPESAPSEGQVVEAARLDASAQRASPSPAADGLPSVEGLDAADGLLRVAGNRNLYTKLLRQFAEQQADAPTRIADALHAGDHAVAERLAHTVKGVAGNLGAGPVHRSAAALEQAIASHGDAKGVDALREGLARDLAALVSGLRAALGVEAAPAPIVPSAASVDPEALRSLVTQMRKQLGEFDPSAADVLEGNRALFHALLPDGDFATFEQHIQGYAFGEAQALLDRAAAARGM